MATLQQDINAALLRKVKELSPDAKSVFKTTYKKAPLVLNFFNFLELHKQDKFATRDAVTHLYGIKANHENYTLYENRFFKLRKKVLDSFNTTPTEMHPVFTPQEIELHEIKTLTVEGKYAEAYPLLIKLEARLWKENIFELLPDVLDLLIHNHQVQRKSADNKPIYQRLLLASEILSDLNQAKLLARQIYDVNFTQGIKAASSLFLKLQRVSINRKSYPRFKLIYNLISATCKLGGGGLDFKPDFKITNRFITVINQLHTLHPNMPDYRFIAGYSATQTYNFQNLKVMNHFNAFHFKDSANLMKALYDSVMEPGSSIRRSMGPVFFSTSCHVLSCGERFNDALKAANDYLHYLRETKQSNLLIKAYMEIANAHIWLYPAKSGYTDTFVIEKINEYLGIVKNETHTVYFTGYASWLKMKLYMAQGDYTNAKKILDSTDFSSYFMDALLRNEVTVTLQMLADHKTTTEKIQQQITTLHTRRFKTTLPPDYINYLFLERLLTQKTQKPDKQFAYSK